MIASHSLFEGIFSDMKLSHSNIDVCSEALTFAYCYPFSNAKLLITLSFCFFQKKMLFAFSPKHLESESNYSATVILIFHGKRFQ